MGFFSEFREFAVKGNVVDLALGVIIGGAFGKIVDSVVKDLIMPVVGKVLGGLDFSNFFIVLQDPPATYKGGMTYAEPTATGCTLMPRRSRLPPWETSPAVGVPIKAAPVPTPLIARTLASRLARTKA